MKQKRNRKESFLLCVYNEGQEASLLLRKVYEQLPDPNAEQEAQVRVIDESGEDYLHPASYFVPIELPKHTEQAVEAAVEIEIQHQR